LPVALREILAVCTTITRKAMGALAQINPQPLPFPIFANSFITDHPNSGLLYYPNYTRHLSE